MFSLNIAIRDNFILFNVAQLKYYIKKQVSYNIWIRKTDTFRNSINFVLTFGTSVCFYEYNVSHNNKNISTSHFMHAL